VKGKDTKSGLTEYLIGAAIVGAIGFLCVWLYAITQWGLLFGLLFGWLPALIGGAVVGLAWPLLVLILIVVMLTHFDTIKLLINGFVDWVL
jgi:hypothetical protein